MNIFWKLKTRRINIRDSKYNTILLILTVFLFSLCLAYLCKGFYTLVFDSSSLGGRDLLERWKEQQYIYSRIYPYRVSPKMIDPQLGKIRSGGYPPWSFFTGFLVFPPISWTATRFYHAFLNILSLSILIRFAYLIGKPFGKISAYFFVAACLAISSHCTTLNNGQYGIIINAFLICVYWCINNYRNNWAGLFLGLALAKPNISIFYPFILIIKKRFKSFFITVFYICFSTFYIVWLTRLDLKDVIVRFVKHIQHVSDDGFSIINVFIDSGLNIELTLLLLSGIAAIVGVLIFHWLQDVSLLNLFAIACVIGRVSIYHRSYDDVMLVFLLLALLQLAFSHTHWLNIFVSMFVGLTLWLPLSLQNLGNPYWSFLQIVVWLVAIVYLLLNSSAINNGITKSLVNN